MKSLNTEETISEAIDSFNKKAYNAGLYFKVVSVSQNSVYVQGSFDFAYYVNVHLSFVELLFTSLSEKDEWPDTWNEDQLEFLINSEAQAILINNEIEYSDDDIFFGFQFNSEPKRYLETGVIVCKTMDIWWEG